MQYEKSNKLPIETAKLNKDYSIRIYMMQRENSLICKKLKFVIPKLLKNM